MNIVHKINLNWNPDNPKLKCKKDYFTDGLFFEVGKEYQIYRIVYYEYEDKKKEAKEDEELKNDSTLPMQEGAAEEDGDTQKLEEMEEIKEPPKPSVHGIEKAKWVVDTSSIGSAEYA